MAHYSKKIFIPAGTLEKYPIVETLTIKENKINYIDVMIDTVATKAIVGVRMSIGLPDHKVWNFPENGGEWLWKSEPSVSPESPVNLPDFNLPLFITCIAPGTTSNHTVVVSVRTSNRSF